MEIPRPQTKKLDLVVAQVPGLGIYEEFISRAEERTLIEAVDKEKWDLSLKRRTQHYGYRYDYQQKNIDKSNFLGSLPPWNDPIVSRMKTANLICETPQQLLVNEYDPGQGISKHTDSSIFGEPVITLSLGSGCIFALALQSARVELYLKPRTLVVLRGDSRWKWTHEIPARKSDQVEGVKIHRGRRISLTYRFVQAQ